VRFKPSTIATTSTAELNNLARQLDGPEDFDSSGCQTVMKSPPGPNLQSGSACRFVSGIIFIGFLTFSKYSEYSAATVTIGKATRITQTKTEQKTAISKVFLRFQFLILIATTIWDHMAHEIPSTPPFLCEPRQEDP